MKLHQLLATALLAATALLCACAPGNSDSRPHASLAAPNKLAEKDEPTPITQVASKDSRELLTEFVPGELLVKFRAPMPGVSIPSAKHGVALQSKRVFRSVRGLQLVKLAAGMSVEDALASLREQADIEYAEPNYIYRKQALPDDPSFPQQWGLDNTGQTQGASDADIDAREAWDITTGSASTVVAVIDSGVDYTHPDLAPNIFSNPADCDADGVDDDLNGYVDDCHGIDTANGDSDPMDEDGHGTHVAGIIAARGNNGIGVTGVAWNARVVACRFMDAQGAGNTADAIACLDYVAALSDHGVNIVATNNSWGAGVSSRALGDAIDRQRQRGILFVAAAGNARSYSEDHDLGTNGYQFESGAIYPCAYTVPNVICVAASTDRDELEPFSYYGAFTPHVFAPGGNIYSTLPGGAYGAMSGTSMAAPHVTGVIALLKSAYPAMNWFDARNRVITGGDYFTRDSRYPNFGWPAISRRRLNAMGALNCLNSTVLRRTEPRTTNPLENYAIGVPIKLSVMNISCVGPAGAISATLNPGNVVIPLHDDGLAGDDYAGDGQYSATWTPTTAGAFTITFPGAVMHYFPDAIGPDDFAVNVHPFLKPGFPVLALQSAGQYINTPETFLANLDGGADTEIVNSSVANGPTYAWKSDGTLLPGWPLERDGRMFHVGYYSAGNLDANPSTLEIAGSAADDGTNVPSDTMRGDPLEAFSSSGQMLQGWPRAAQNYIRNPPVMVDFDLDGRDEMFLGGNDWYLRGMRYDAESVPGFEFGQQTSGSGPGVGTPLAADLDADGRPELVFTGRSMTGIVFATINGVTGTAVRTEREITDDIALFAIGDVDGDGTMNILGYQQLAVPPLGGVPVVSVLSPEGAVLRTFPTSVDRRNLNGSVLADLDRDGIPELVVTQSYFDGYFQTALLEIAVFRGDGSPLAGFPVTLRDPATSTGSMSAPVIGDVDGDGLPEIVVNADGALFVVNHDGSQVPGTPFQLPREFRFYTNASLSPGLADLDGDGRNDIVLTSEQWDGRAGWLPEVFAFDLRGPATHGPIEWGQKFEGAHRRGAYITGKNLVSDAYLAIRTQGEGRVTSSSPAFQCQDHCLRRYAKSTALTVMAVPTTGGSFLGWRGACAGQGATCHLTLAAYAATSAIFSSKTLTVTVEGSGTVTSDLAGIQCPSICSAEYQSSQTVTLTATPASNSTFIGWSGSTACQPTNPVCVLPMNVSRSVNARFEHRRVLSLLISSGAGSGTVSSNIPGVECSTSQCSMYVDYGAQVVLTATPAANRTIDWAGNCSGAGTQPTCTVSMTDAKTVVVDFPLRVVVTVTRGGSGSGTVTTLPAGIDCGSTCSAVFDSDTTLRLVATPNADSAFSGWTGVCSGAGDCFTTPQSDISINANFTLKLPLQVTRDGSGTVASNIAGIDCGADCSEQYVPGTVLRLTATPAAQYSFEGWSGACQGTSSNCIVTMDQARNVSARFAPWPELTVTRAGTGSGSVSSTPAGVDCGNDCSERYAPASSVTLTATAAAGSSFTAWSGACTGNAATCTVSIAAATSVTSTFTRTPAPSSSSSSSGGGGGGGGRLDLLFLGVIALMLARRFALRSHRGRTLEK